MYRLNPHCWVRSPRPPPCLLPQHSAVLSHREEEEDEDAAEEHPAVCCSSTVYGDDVTTFLVQTQRVSSAGSDDVIGLSADAQWSTSVPPIHSGVPSSSGLAGRAAPPSQQPKTVTGADGRDVSRHLIGGRCWEGPGTETPGCVCAYGRREPEALGTCWPGSPYVYYGVRMNLVVGVEVVDTLEVITEDIYTDDLLDSELLQDEQLYPT